MRRQKIRISKKRDFDNVFKNGKSIRGAFLILRFVKNNLENSRFAFLVSKKVSARAVVRNKIRRRLQESVKNFMGGLKENIDAVFIVNPSIKDKNFFETKEEVEKILNKIPQR